MSREVRPQQPMTDVRASYAHASPRSLREHPRPCATLARALGFGCCAPEPRVPLVDGLVAAAIEARRPLIATERDIVASATLRECASVGAAQPPASASAARAAARLEAPTLVQEGIPC